MTPFIFQEQVVVATELFEFLEFFNNRVISIENAFFIRTKKIILCSESVSGIMSIPWESKRILRIWQVIYERLSPCFMCVGSFIL